MGRGFKGRNGEEYFLTYEENWVIYSLLKQLVRRPVDFDKATALECKGWAAVLRKNTGRMRLLELQGAEFGVLDKADIAALFSTGVYAEWAKGRITTSEITGAPVEPLSDSWKESILEFADFLDSSGGLVSLRP